MPASAFTPKKRLILVTAQQQRTRDLTFARPRWSQWRSMSFLPPGHWLGLSSIWGSISPMLWLRLKTSNIIFTGKDQPLKIFLLLHMANFMMCWRGWSTWDTLPVWIGPIKWPSRVLSPAGSQHQRQRLGNSTHQPLFCLIFFPAITVKGPNSVFACGRTASTRFSQMVAFVPCLSASSMKYLFI